MPFFNTNKHGKILYIHIPKTGGSSVEAYFYKHHDFTVRTKPYTIYGYKLPDFDISAVLGHSTLQHCTYQEIVKHSSIFQLHQDDLNECTIIATVRNPYHRIVSDLFFFELIRENSTQIECENAVTHFLANGPYKHYTPEWNYDNHRKSQHEFLYDIDTTKTHIIKQEGLTQGMHDLGYVDFDGYENVNRTKTPASKYMDLLTSVSVQLINDFYSKDFEIFGYSKISL